MIGKFFKNNFPDGLSIVFTDRQHCHHTPIEPTQENNNINLSVIEFIRLTNELILLSDVVGQKHQTRL